MIGTSNTKGMPKPEGSMWSDDQWRAISESGNNMLVAAAAGSGKTAVLVERIIRKIVDPQLGFSVDRLLVATFTKAAAAEMRQRIREALERVLEQEPESEHVRRQLSLLNRASITTLHSFCMEVIRRHYQAIPLDPGFRIMNEHETELLRQELLEELFEEKYEAHDEGSTFRRLVDWFSGERTDDAMYVLVQRLYDFSQSHPWPEHWLRETAAAFRVQDVAALGETPWVRSILADAALSLRGAASLLEQAHETAMQPGGPAPYAVTLQEDAAMVKGLLQELETQPWASLYDHFQTASFGKLKPVKKIRPSLHCRNGLKRCVKQPKNDYRYEGFPVWQESRSLLGGAARRGSADGRIDRNRDCIRGTISTSQAVKRAGGLRGFGTLLSENITTSRFYSVQATTFRRCARIQGAIRRGAAG